MKFLTVIIGLICASAAAQPLWEGRAPRSGQTLYVDGWLGNDSSAVRGVSDRPWRTITNAIASARDGDTVEVVAQGDQVITNSILLPYNFTLKGHGYWITDAIRRVTPNGLDPGDNTLDGPLFVPRDNCVIDGVRFAGLPNGNAMQNAPVIGTIYFDKNPWTFTNFTGLNIYATNLTVAWYCRHTNRCDGRFFNSDFNCYKNPGFVSYGPHFFEYFNCRFVADGPDTIWNDSVGGQAVGFRALSGTNWFYGCYFRGTNPTNTLSTLGDTNAIGFEIERGENGQVPAAYLIGCKFDSSNTNTSPVSPSWDILNGQQLTGESSPLYVSGCTFDRTKVYGPITEIALPVTGGVTATADTNKFIAEATGTFDGNITTFPNSVYTIDSSLLPTIKYTNSTGYYLTNVVANNWSFFDNFDSLAATNKFTGWFTNGFFTSANVALNTNNHATIRYFYGPVTNAYSISPLGVPLSASALLTISKGLVIKSNTLASIPALSPGDVYIYSSNGIAYRILVGPSGTRTTNTW